MNCNLMSDFFNIDFFKNEMSSCSDIIHFFSYNHRIIVHYAVRTVHIYLVYNSGMKVMLARQQCMKLGLIGF